MAWEKPAAELVARFDACLPPAPGVDRRQMFGCACAFINGNMFAGLHEQKLIVRLPEAQREALGAAAAAEPFVVLGRTMREYMAVADAMSRPKAQIAALIAAAFAHADSLPPRKSKAKTRAPGAAAKRRP